MKSSYQKICQLLASSGFREKDFLDFASELLQIDPRAFSNDIAQIRQWMTKSPNPGLFDTPLVHSLPASSSDFENTVERLLLHEARIPKLIAIQQLTEELRLRFPDLEVPSASKRGFQAWVRKLTSIFSEREILHIATNLRNRTVHDSPTDWRLK